MRFFLFFFTLSRLSTSARKPDIMGTSMTAMLEEPEWSHLDGVRNIQVVKGKFFILTTHKVFFYIGNFWPTWHRLLKKFGSPFYPGGPPGRRRRWAPAASGSARSGCPLGSEGARKGGVGKRRMRRRKRRWRKEAAGVAPDKVPSGPP